MKHRTKLRTAILTVAISLVGALVLIEGFSRLYVAVLESGEMQTRWDFRATRPAPYANATYFSPAFLAESAASVSGRFAEGSTFLTLNDFVGAYVNVVDGMRATTDQPDGPARRVLLFGGSTLFSVSVPDRETIPSQLQRFANAGCRSQSYRMFNYGVPSMNARQQLDRLRRVGLEPGDLVIFYDGINEIYYSIFKGAIDGYQGKTNGFRPVHLLPWYQRWLYRIFSPYRGMSAAAWLLSNLYDRGIPSTITDPGRLTRNLDAAQEAFYRTLVAAHRLVTERGGTFVHFLQPHLFAETSPSEYERRIAANYLETPPGLETAFRIGYPRLRAAIADAGAAGVVSFDLSGILATGRTDEEYFLDFGHVNHAANRRIARAIYEKVFVGLGCRLQ